MTYPPQQPGPYGQEPYGQQPGSYGQDPTAQYGQQPPGYGGYPGGPGGPPPKKSNAGVIAAVVAGAVLVLGGAGTGIYFLTKGEDTPANTASAGSQTSTSKPKTSGSQPRTKTSDRTGGGSTPTRTSSGGGGGGGGGTADAAIIEVAEKYAKAVTDKDESTAKSLTCENDTGLLFDSGGKVEVTGKPETYGEDSASINVKVTLSSGDPIEDFPLFLDKKDASWCVSV